MVVYFADHLAHSIQIDAINRLIERNTSPHDHPGGGGPIEEAPPEVPEWAVPLIGKNSGYIQTVHPELLLPLAAEPGSPSVFATGSGNTWSREQSSAGCGRAFAGRAAAERRVL